MSNLPCQQYIIFLQAQGGIGRREQAGLGVSHLLTQGSGSHGNARHVLILKAKAFLCSWAFLFALSLQKAEVMLINQDPSHPHLC